MDIVASDGSKKIRLFRTFSRSPKEEFDILSNNREQDNILTTPSTAIIPQIRFSSISSIIDIENRWANKPNLVFEPTKEETLSRTGTTITLLCPASLHTCRTGDLITKYNAEDKLIDKPLFERFLEFGEYMDNDWDTDVTRDNKNLGMPGKYTEFSLHDNLQGKQLYQKGYEFIESIKNTIPQKGADLYKYVIKETDKNIGKEKQDKIFESHKKYAKFLNSTVKSNVSPYIIKACKKYRHYLENSPNENRSYFDVIGNDLYRKMREEIISHYVKYINNGFRHNEFIGRLFPWEIKSIEIGHVNDKKNKKEVLQKVQLANKYCIEFMQLRKKMLEEIKRYGFNHLIIKEFIDAKNNILFYNNEAPLNDNEKKILLNKIMNQLSKNIYVSSYQNGIFEKIDLPSDSVVFNPKISQRTLNESAYSQISQRLRKVAGSSTSLKQFFTEKFDDSGEILQHARNALKAFLASGIEFNLTGSKEDSGALVILLLKEKYPNLTDREIVENNVDSFNLDSCMSVISSACYLNEKLKEKYEFNHQSDISSESDSYATSILDHDKTIFRSYADKNQALDPKRPLINYSVNGYGLLFNQMQKETQNNLREA